MAAPAPNALCTALNLQNEAKCVTPAQSANGLFCAFHAKQCHALYVGYKRRTAELESLEQNPPPTLPKDYGNTDWASFSSAVELRKVQEYLNHRLLLLHRCITARDWHHSHFYGDNSDFGHQKFLDRLRGNRVTVTGALLRIERRMLGLKYKDAEWMEWVRSLQLAEDTKSAAEKKKVKAEHALFRENQAKIEKAREEEEKRRREEREKEEVWDPVEDIIEEQRIRYVALLRMLLRKEGVGEQEEEMALKMARDLAGNTEGLDEEALERYRAQREAEGKGVVTRMEMEKDIAFVARPFMVTMGEPSEKRLSNATDDETKKKLAELEDIEDLEMKRLIERMNRLAHMERGVSNYNLKDREESLKKVREESTTIREYMMIRLITKNPAFLIVALECESLNEFLAHPNLRNTDLRDLALQLALNSKELIRDACSDYWAEIALEKEQKAVPSTGKAEPEGKQKQLAIGSSQPKAVSAPKKNGKFIIVDGKKIPVLQGKDEPEVVETHRTERVLVCGRWIHNYPEERRLPRRGWFQFAMITGCNLWRAIELCNSWEEFHDLNHLSLQGYFIGTNMIQLGENDPVFYQHARRMGFVPYARSTNAEQATGSSQSGRHGRTGRVHTAAQTRNYICANMGRDLDGTRRFIAMAKAWCSEVVIWARDCKTGKIITEPPEKERWFRRVKAGPGRANRGQWTVTDEFSTQWKASIDANRPWRFKFRDCVDIVIWDRWPGRHHEMFETSVLTLLNKGMKLKDQISVMETTFNVYKKCLEEEEGPKGKKTLEAKAILEDMRQFRLNRTSAEMKGKAPFLFYDEVDEQIDWAYGIYDNDPYWKRVDGHEVDNMYDLSKKINAASSQGEHNLLMTPYYIHVLKAAFRPRIYKDDMAENGVEAETKLRLVNGKEVTYGRFPEAQEDDGDEEWEDEDDDDESDISYAEEVWFEAHEEAEYFEEWATDFAEDVYQAQIKRDPAEFRKFEAARQFILDLQKKGNVNQMNERTRRKLAEKQAELTAGGIAFIPHSSLYCQAIIFYLWGDDMTPLGGVQDSFEILKDTAKRAANPPPRRRRVPPKEIWDKYDALVAEQGHSPEDIRNGDFKPPKSWDHEIRLTIAQLYKEGVIKPTYELHCSQAIAGGEPLRMYIDYRQLVGRIIPYGPKPPGPEYLKEEMEKWAAKYPQARFSLLKMKSAEFFWKREWEGEDATNTAIQDTQGRIWEWTQHPKDCPFSEYYMHESLCRIRAGPPRVDRRNDIHMTSDMEERTRVRIDTVLILCPDGSDKSKEFTWFAAANYRKRPLGVDPDWARSFVNVDVEFLRALGDEWWD
ncbi:hypothetical protein FN846DRAFT_944613 [Sphaerosporella brunnea]|uniref:Uncharacterized protein n=1 Tax=Sphaerosporella brunnea TaxID=1250544 RepID=A0A5J5EZK2_9PEZI|nr:hypothetical protein FN846DRAFT_944613 [Sphaerosporella brunnea]